MTREASNIFGVTILGANVAPTWSSIPTLNVSQSATYSLNLGTYCTDADADPLTYSIVSGTLPTGLNLSGVTISGTTSAAVGTYSVTVRANDGQGHTADAVLNFSVNAAANVRPVWSLTSIPVTITKGIAFYLDLKQYCTDGNGDTITFIINKGVFPAGIAMTSDGVVSGTSTDAYPIVQNVEVRALDPYGAQSNPHGTVVFSYVLDGHLSFNVAAQNFVLGTPYTYSFAEIVKIPAGVTSSVAAGYTLPAGVTLDGVNHALIYDGTAAAFTGTLKLSLTDGATVSESNIFPVTISSHAVVTYTAAIMPTEGFDSPRGFDDTQVRNNKIIESGGNNHGYENNNGIRFFDPSTMTAGYIHPWDHGTAPYVPGSTDPNNILISSWPANYVCKNRNYYTYDNTHQMYVESVDKLIEMGGQFIYDFSTDTFTHGNAPPFASSPLSFDSNKLLVQQGPVPADQQVTGYVDKDAGAISAWGAGAAFYDGLRAYCKALDIGIWLTGGTGIAGSLIGILRRNPNYPGSSTKPFMARVVGLGTLDATFNCRSRTIKNGAVVGTSLFCGGGGKKDLYVPNKDCYLLDLNPCASGLLFGITATYADALAEAMSTMQNGVDAPFVQFTLDTTRNRVLLVGKKLLAWDLTTQGPWVDISPAGWGWDGAADTVGRGWAWACGFYHAGHDRLYFKATAITTNGQPVTYGHPFNYSESSRIRYVQFS